MSPEEAHIILLERELDHAAQTIAFLHHCLTNDIFEYAYPEETASTLRRIRGLVPEREMCFHSGTVDDCSACAERNRQFALYAEAEEVYDRSS